MYRTALASSLVAAVLLTGCGGGDAADPSARGNDPADTATGSPTPSAQPADPVGDSTGEEPSEEPASTPTGEAPPAAPEPPPVVWPDEVMPVHGGSVWAVYLAVGSPASDAEVASLAETDSYLRRLGYAGSGIGSVGCDQGAAETLGFAPDANRVAVYFDSAARAQQFAAAYPPEDLGSAQVATYCLD